MFLTIELLKAYCCPVPTPEYPEPSLEVPGAQYPLCSLSTYLCYRPSTPDPCCIAAPSLESLCLAWVPARRPPSASPRPRITSQESAEEPPASPPAQTSGLPDPVPCLEEPRRPPPLLPSLFLNLERRLRVTSPVEDGAWGSSPGTRAS